MQGYFLGLPCHFGIQPPAATVVGGRARRRFIGKRAAGIALDAGGRKIADPFEVFGRRQRLAIPGEHRIAGLARRR